MRHSVPQKRDAYQMLSDALAEGWQTIDTLPLRGEGVFLVLTISGLIRHAHSRNAVRTSRRADAYGPKRSSVVAEDSGNYLAAIAWKWPDN